MERRCQGFSNDLLCFNVIGDVSLFLSEKMVTILYGMWRLTKSFAPRFRKRAPAKYRDRLAITVICAVRPYIESAVLH